MVRGASVLAAGTAAGQALILLAMPLVTRLYTPEDFGVLAVYASVLALLVVIITLKFETAIVLADSDETASQLLLLSLLAAVAVSATAGLGVLFAGSSMAAWFNADEIAPYLWLIPISGLGAGIYQTFSFWALRRKLYRRLAATRITQSIWMVLAQLIVGSVSPGPFGLILGDSMRWAGGSTTLVTTALRQDSSLLRRARWAGMAGLVRRYRKFPLITAPSSLANSLGQQLPPLLIAAFYGPYVAGGFFLVQKVLAVPVTLLGRAVGNVYIGELSAVIRQNPAAARRIYVRTAMSLFAVGVLPVAILIIGGRALLPFVFGSEWAEAGVYLQIVAAMVLVKFVVNPLSHTLLLLEKQGVQMAWDTARLVGVNAAIVAVAKAELGAVHAVAAYSVTMALAYVALYWLSYRYLNRVPGGAPPASPVLASH